MFYPKIQNHGEEGVWGYERCQDIPLYPAPGIQTPHSQALILKQKQKARLLMMNASARGACQRNTECCHNGLCMSPTENYYLELTFHVH